MNELLKQSSKSNFELYRTEQNNKKVNWQKKPSKFPLKMFELGTGYPESAMALTETFLKV